MHSITVLLFFTLQVYTLAYSCSSAPLFFVELFDVGGSAESAGVEQSRAIFFENCHAVVFVWDGIV
jgi:hypothetical protein